MPVRWRDLPDRRGRDGRSWVAGWERGVAVQGGDDPAGGERQPSDGFDPSGPGG